MDCIFCKIANKQIPSATVYYEDDRIVIFKDLDPKAPVHILAIPKEHISSVNDITDFNCDIIAYIFKKIADLSAKLNLQNGFRIVTNCGKDGGQTVNHLHFHILGGRKLEWPPG
jgi:histidine triad (HIT) family protein